MIDYETTGFSPQRGDRIVSFAALELIDDIPTGKCINLIFNPGRKSYPAALRVHGLSDEMFLSINRHSRPTPTSSGDEYHFEQPDRRHGADLHRYEVHEIDGRP